MVIACNLGVLVGFATVFIYSFSLMVKPWQHEFGWNREQISRGFSLAAISVAICSSFMGRLFDRFEPRKIIASFMAVFGLGVGSLAWLTPHLAQFYVTAVGIGIAGAGTGTYQSLDGRLLLGWLLDYLEGAPIAAFSLLSAGGGLFLLAHAQSFARPRPQLLSPDWARVASST